MKELIPRKLLSLHLHTLIEEMDDKDLARFAHSYLNATVEYLDDREFIIEWHE